MVWPEDLIGFESQFCFVILSNIIGEWSLLDKASDAVGRGRVKCFVTYQVGLSSSFFFSLACVASSDSYPPTGRLSAVSAEKETGMAILPPSISPSIPLTILMMINGGRRPVVQSVRESPFSRAVVSSITRPSNKHSFMGQLLVIILVALPPYTTALQTAPQHRSPSRATLRPTLP